MELTAETITKAYSQCDYFLKHIYPLSFIGREQYIHGKHIEQWGRMLQDGNTCLVSARKHSKSVTMYGYLQWRMLQFPEQDYEIVYMSFKEKLARYHINNFKTRVRENSFFKELQDLTHQAVEGIAKYSWDGTHKITIKPAGIQSFERGKHPDELIVDDVLADPTSTLQLGIIDKINRLMRDVAFSLPKEGGRIKIVGTAQTHADFLWGLKKAPHFTWGMFPAITNWKKKEVLWEEMFPWKRLMEIREWETGHKGFDKEYMCAPVWSTESYFQQKDIMEVVNSRLKNMNGLKTKNDVGLGWDIGKHNHPAHVAVFEFVPIGGGLDLAVQRHDKWMEGWEYKQQLDYVKGLVERMNVDYVNFDNTRGELEGFYEQGHMPKHIYFPQTFNTKYKNKIAAQFEKRVMFEVNGKKSPSIQLMNIQRTINQILVVTNDLDAVQTHEGHGDSFWSIALALDKKRTGRTMFLQDPENILGLQ